MTAPSTTSEMLIAELLPLAQAFVDRKYTAHSDSRQQAIGLAYVTAERQDLAKELARFAADHIARLEAALKEARTDARFSADESELLITWPGLRISIGADGTGYCFIRDGKFVPGKYSIIEQPIEAAKEIIASHTPNSGGEG